MIYALEISDETAALIRDIGSKMRLPAELTDGELLEFVIDAMANSIDSQFDIAASDESTPLQMEEALNTLLNPNISSVYKQPDTGQPISTRLTWEQIVALMPTVGGKPVEDPITQQAIVIVFNELPQEEWTSTHCEVLVDKTIALLKSKQQQTQGEIK